MSNWQGSWPLCRYAFKACVHYQNFYWGSIFKYWKKHMGNSIAPNMPLNNYLFIHLKDRIRDRESFFSHRVSPELPARTRAWSCWSHSGLSYGCQGLKPCVIIMCLCICISKVFIGVEGPGSQTGTPKMVVHVPTGSLIC